MNLSSHALRAARAIALATLSSSLVGCSSGETSSTSSGQTTSSSSSSGANSSSSSSSSSGSVARDAGGDAPLTPDAQVADAEVPEDDSGLPPGAGPLAPPELPDAPHASQPKAA